MLIRYLLAFVSSRLLAANTHAVGYAGLAVGGVTLAVGSYGLYSLFTDFQYLTDLYWAVIHARAHAQTPADVVTFAKLVAASIACFVGLVSALLGTYFGKPRTVPNG